MTAAVVLIGVGNPWRRDDGVGHEVAKRATGQTTVGHDLVLCDGEPSGLVDAWTDRQLAIVVDATRGSGSPGDVRVWHDEAPTASANVTGSHALGAGHALALGKALGRLPARLVVVGIEIDDMSHGRGLSPAVSAAVDEAVGAVVGALQAGS
ncbi:MAG TPA: hydrogenase maturation protease [Ilumatobacteraceae bacterium]|nr:hydrogenase maturation protease [Ilumatobacteraceae bacterium]